jgi:hypothetical protein
MTTNNFNRSGKFILFMKVAHLSSCAVNASCVPTLNNRYKTLNCNQIPTKKIERGRSQRRLTKATQIVRWRQESTLKHRFSLLSQIYHTGHHTICSPLLDFDFRLHYVCTTVFSIEILLDEERGQDRHLDAFSTSIAFRPHEYSSKSQDVPENRISHFSLASSILCFYSSFTTTPSI